MEAPVIAAFVAGTAGLSGAIIGSILSWAGSIVNEKRRWHREDCRRFESDRRIAYSKLLACVSRLATEKDKSEKVAPGTNDRLVSDTLSALAEVEIIGSERVRQMASNFVRSVCESVMFNPASTQSATEWGERRKRYVLAVRVDLGIEPDPT